MCPVLVNSIVERICRMKQLIRNLSTIIALLSGFAIIAIATAYMIHVWQDARQPNIFTHMTGWSFLVAGFTCWLILSIHTINKLPAAFPKAQRAKARDWLEALPDIIWFIFIATAAVIIGSIRAYTARE